MFYILEPFQIEREVRNNKRQIDKKRELSFDFILFPIKLYTLCGLEHVCTERYISTYIFLVYMKRATDVPIVS